MKHVFFGSERKSLWTQNVNDNGILTLLNIVMEKFLVSLLGNVKMYGSNVPLMWIPGRVETRRF